MEKINCILLIDDSEPTNVFNKYMIGKANVCNYVKVAIDGEEALAYINKSAEPGQEETFPKPDLIFLDINMPRMNGFEFLEEYRKLDEKIKSKVLIILLTTSLNPDDQKRSLEYKEITGFQNKPITLKMVTEIIEKYFTPKSVTSVKSD